MRVGGNRKLYLKLVRQFVGDERDAVVRIRERLAAGDHATAERMAHTVKGVAASLGARELQAIAGDLERAVKERAPTEPLCDRLAGALSAFAAAVGSTLGEPAPAPSSEPSGGGPGQIRRAVTRMDRCLTEFDPRRGRLSRGGSRGVPGPVRCAHAGGLRAPRRELCVRRSAEPAERGDTAARDRRERDVHIMSERILIVDDTPANIQMLMAILKKEGYQLSAATNGRQALEVIEKVAPDLVLMDVMMPDMDGYEACERIKASTRWRDLPIIFLTAKTDIADIVRGFEVGAVDYVGKPFNGHELLARVHTHLTLQRLRREMESRNAELARELEVAQEMLTDARRRVDAALMGDSPAIRALRESIARDATHVEPVLLTGPPGAGHEATARAIHHASPRSRQAFIHVNCALLPPGKPAFWTRGRQPRTRRWRIGGCCSAPEPPRSVGWRNPVSGGGAETSERGAGRVGDGLERRPSCARPGRGGAA